MTIDFLHSQSALDIIFWVFVGSGIIQLSPIRLNPWSWIGQQIGKVLNEEVISKIQGLEGDVKQIRDDLNEDRAVTARVRILRFNDELLQGLRHSKESFDQALSDIDNYEFYCMNHVEFKNNRTVMAVQNIKKKYEKCMLDNDFL